MKQQRILVVGASGQLGGQVLAQLARRGAEAVAFVRDPRRFDAAVHSGVALAVGDLLDYSSVERACEGMDAVIATASTIVPRKGDVFGEYDVTYYEHLTRACRERGVGRLVFVSAYPSRHDERVPEFRVKRRIEDRIRESGVRYTIFRAAAFMDVYFAVMGSASASLGSTAATLKRGYWLTSLYSRLVEGLIECHGIALYPGSGRTRQAFIAIDDVARFLVAAAMQSSNDEQVFDLGGPRGLAWREVAGLYAELLGRQVRGLPLPVPLLRGLAVALRPFAPAAENIMALLAVLGEEEFVPEMAAVCERFGIQPMDARDFIATSLEKGLSDD